MSDNDYHCLTVGELKRFLAEHKIPDDALVGEPPFGQGDREFIPFEKVDLMKIKRAEPTKDAPWIRYFSSTEKLARIPALVLTPR